MKVEINCKTTFNEKIIYVQKTSHTNNKLINYRCWVPTFSNFYANWPNIFRLQLIVVLLHWRAARIWRCVWVWAIPSNVWTTFVRTRRLTVRTTCRCRKIVFVGFHLVSRRLPARVVRATCGALQTDNVKRNRRNLKRTPQHSITNLLKVYPVFQLHISVINIIVTIWKQQIAT